MSDSLFHSLMTGSAPTSGSRVVNIGALARRSSRPVSTAPPQVSHAPPPPQQTSHAPALASRVSRQPITETKNEVLGSASDTQKLAQKILLQHRNEQARVDTLTKDNHLLEQRVKTMVATNEELLSSNNELGNGIQQFSEQVKELRSRLASAETLNSYYHQLARKVEDGKGNVDADLQDAREQLQSVQELHELISQKEAEFEKAIDEKHATHEAEREALEAELHSAKKAATEQAVLSDDALRQARKETEEAKSVQRQLAGDLDAVKNQLQDEKTKFASKEQALADLESALESEKTLNLGLNESAATLTKENDAMRLEITKLQAAISSVEAESSAAHERIAALEKEQESTAETEGKHLAATEKKIEKLEQARQEALEEMENSKNEHEAVVHKLEREKASLQKSNKELKSASTTAKRQGTKKQKDLEKQLEKMQRELDKAVGRASTTEQLLQTRDAELSAAQESHRAEIKAAQQAHRAEVKSLHAQAKKPATGQEPSEGSARARNRTRKTKKSDSARAVVSVTPPPREKEMRQAKKRARSELESILGASSEDDDSQKTSRKVEPVRRRRRTEEKAEDETQAALFNPESAGWASPRKIPEGTSNRKTTRRPRIAVGHRASPKASPDIFTQGVFEFTSD